MRNKTVFVVAGICALVVLAASVAAAGTWTETGDAGDLPGTAQVPSGSGALTAISGAVSVSADANMYKLCLTGGGTFSATTVGTGTLGDTQLFLFNAGGFGVEANDDAGSFTILSTLPAGGLSPAAPGAYYLAVSRFNRDPVSAGGLIFPNTPFTGVKGPTGPGGGSPISGWSGTSGTGAYTVALTGARFCRQVVTVDIKPGSSVNPVNLKTKGVIPVAILTTPDFDATTVNPLSVCFGDAGDASQRDCTEAHGQGHIEDVDGDGDNDLVLHFETQETGIDPGDTQACLTGTATNGETVEGCDTITITP